MRIGYFLAVLSLAAGPAMAQSDGLQVSIQAAPGAAYSIKCHVRTYRTKEGGIANTYAIVNKGPYKDLIPSANAQCQLWKTGGPGPVTLHIFKAGDHAVTVGAPGSPVSLQVW